MKKKEQFIIREIAGKSVLVPFGEKAIDFNGIIALNDTAKFLWENIDGEINPDALQKLLVAEYEIDGETAASAVNSFIKQLKEVDCVEE